jgi:hypothetical protein
LPKQFCYTELIHKETGLKKCRESTFHTSENTVW